MFLCEKSFVSFVVEHFTTKDTKVGTKGNKVFGTNNLNMIKRLIVFAIIVLVGFSNAIAQNAGYYNGAEGKSGNELKTALHGIIKGHVDFSYSDAKYILNYADSDPNNESNVICIYTRRSQANTSWGSGGDFLNREHVWAKSHGNFVDVRPMDGDAFNLHPCDASTNIARSNYDFDECSGIPGATLIAEANAYYTSTQFEPQDAAKGEVARTLFYMAARYEGTDGEMNLEMIDQVGNYPNPKFGKLSTLLQWNNDFPPTPNERRRNERVFEAQRNRNPFIDNPEYANMIWGGAAAPAVSISSVEMIPQFPVNTESAIISAVSSSTAGTISSATLYYGSEYNSETYSSVMTENGGIWSGDIDFTHFAENSYVYYKITSSDGANSNSLRGTYRLPAAKTITPISSVQGTGTGSPLVGTTVTVTGIVTANLDNTYYIQTPGDSLSGMCIYDIRRGRLGDSVVVTGNVSEYSSLTEIDAVSYFYNYGQRTKATPKVLTVSQVKENYEDMLVTIKNASFVDGDKIIALTAQVNLSFSDATGTMIVYSRYNSRISGKLLPAGNVDVTGVISQYGSAYQLLVNDISDIKMVGDAVPPVITDITVYDKDNIVVSFNEKLIKTSLENVSNYAFSNGLTILSAYEYGAGKVLLIVTGMKKTDYTLTINGVKDLQGNTMVNVTKDFHSDFEDPAFTQISCVDDAINATDKSLIKIDAVANDILPSAYSVTITKLPAYGTATVNADFSINYETLMGGAPVVKDTIVYEICNSLDPLKCGQASIFINIDYTKLITCNNDTVESTELNTISIYVTENDTVPANFNLSITREPFYGTASVEPDFSITYTPQIPIALGESGMEGTVYNDTIKYQICYLNAPEICLEASVFITLDLQVSVNELGYKQFALYPVPVINELHIKAAKEVAGIDILDITGKTLFRQDISKSDFTVPMAGLRGIYFIRITMASGEVVMRKVVKL